VCNRFCDNGFGLDSRIREIGFGGSGFLVESFGRLGILRRRCFNHAAPDIERFNGEGFSS
jgi:hypothetical protein